MGKTTEQLEVELKDFAVEIKELGIVFDDKSTNADRAGALTKAAELREKNAPAPEPEASPEPEAPPAPPDPTPPPAPAPAAPSAPAPAAPKATGKAPEVPVGSDTTEVQEATEDAEVAEGFPQVEGKDDKELAKAKEKRDDVMRDKYVGKELGGHKIGDVRMVEINGKEYLEVHLDDGTIQPLSERDVIKQIT